MGLEGCELHAFELGGAMFKERLGLGACCSLKGGEEEEEEGWPSLLASFGIEKGRSEMSGGGWKDSPLPPSSSKP